MDPTTPPPPPTTAAKTSPTAENEAPPHGGGGDDGGPHDSDDGGRGHGAPTSHDDGGPPEVSDGVGAGVREMRRRIISWAELKESFGFERVAHGCDLTGEVAFRSSKEDYNSFVRLRDADGGEGTLFFYDKEESPNRPSFDQMHMGSTVTIRSPRYHRFLDGQEGMRVESLKSIVSVVSRHHLSDRQRLEYAESHRIKGNAFFEAGKYDDASREYYAAFERVDGSFLEEPDKQNTANKLAATCQLNLALCCLKERQWYRINEYCEKALTIPLNDDQRLSVIAKAHYRMGIAALELGNFTAAASHLQRSNNAHPNDPLVGAALHRLEEVNCARRRTEKNIGKATSRVGRPFGYCPRLFNDEKIRIVNFRDIGNAERTGVQIKRHMLYRSSALTRISADDLHVLTEVLGIKTVVDLRRGAEVSFVLRGVEAGLDSRNTAQVYKPTRYSNSRTPAGHVTIHFDLLLSTILHVGRWWHIALLFIGVIVRWAWAISYAFHHTIGQVVPSEAYKAVVDANPRNIRNIFSLLSKAENYPVVISCTLGKDRTGIVVALVLSVLGMPLEAIVEDFTISDRELRESSAKGLLKYAEWSAADATSLRFMLESLNECYGSVEGYVRSIGVTEQELENLRSILLDAK